MKLAFLWLLLAVTPLLAQNDLQANVNLQFRFVNPGARAQALGGAFVGLADDTTAIFSNPAGLTQMSRATLVLEGNLTERKNNIPFYSGAIRQTNLQDFDFDLQGRNFKKKTASIPFVGYVAPKGRIKWGVFLAEQGNFERSFETLGVAFPSYPRDVGRTVLTFFPPSDNFTNIQLRTLGFSLAGKLTSTLSAGVTVSYNQFDYQSGGTFRFPNLEELFPDTTFSPNELAVFRQLYGEEYGEVALDGKDEKPAIYAGLLLKPTERFSVGLAYKQQPSFDYNTSVRSRDGNFEWEEPVLGDAVFNIPDSYALGISFRPNDLTVFSMEVNRILYSELSDDHTQFFDSSNDPIGASQFTPDVTEYHIGVEYVMVNFAYPLSLRAGYFHEPYHAAQNTVLDTQLLFRYLNQNNTQTQDSRGAAFLHRFAQDLNHLTVGLGLTVGDVIFDLSADVDDENKSYSLSSIYRFQ